MNTAGTDSVAIPGLAAVPRAAIPRGSESLVVTRPRQAVPGMRPVVVGVLLAFQVPMRVPIQVLTLVAVVALVTAAEPVV